jgi:hypothetical protein
MVCSHQTAQLLGLFFRSFPLVTMGKILNEFGNVVLGLEVGEDALYVPMRERLRIAHQ